MPALIFRDNGRLRRIERAISEFETRPASEQRRKQALLAALYRELDEIGGAPPRPRGG